MGSIDFVTHMGWALEARETDAADAIKEKIEEGTSGTSALTVSFGNGFVTLGGEASAWVAAEEAMLMAGNVEGVGKVVSNFSGFGKRRRRFG